MKWFQKQVELKPMSRGFHLITQEVLKELPEIQNIKVGLAHLLLKHTSASLTLNENFDPDVRKDMESYFNNSVKENEPYFLHTSEGADDMPAHIKSSLLGNSLTIPITEGHFNLGTWQGIYLCEHRNHGGRRKLLITVQGD
ncbi:MAG: secondary thiamine-phosphate synthase enzyme YjbQ [Ignavibacteria bacterium]|nr:secondary thiamine-phosphate synthase enzyme YjbQ [Ignavibacteria bacterium]